MPASVRKQIETEIELWQTELPKAEGDLRNLCRRLRFVILIILGIVLIVAFLHPLYGIPGAISITVIFIGVETGCLDCSGKTRLLKSALLMAKTITEDAKSSNAQLTKAGNDIANAVKSLTCVIKLVKGPFANISGGQHAK